MKATKSTKPNIYMRQRPELTPCYRILQNHLNTFISDRDWGGRPLPNYVIKEFDAFLECGIPLDAANPDRAVGRGKIYQKAAFPKQLIAHQ